jgi:hypothetical protein
VRVLREIDRRLEELSAAERAAEEHARFELARSASRFSRRTKKVVDDTMSLSATLVRAGEVDEANRLMLEAERQVRDEEAALIETVNEAKAAGANRRRTISQLRIARTVATAFLSGSMFVFSAFGVVLARQVFADDPTVQRPAQRGPELANGSAKRIHSIEVAPGVKLRLTSAEVKELTRLAGNFDKKGLREFLVQRLPNGLVVQIQGTLLSLAGQVLDDEGMTLSLRGFASEARSESASWNEEDGSEGDGWGDGWGGAEGDGGTAAEADDDDEPTPSEEPEPTPDDEASPSPEPSPTQDRDEDPDDNHTPLGWPPLSGGDGEGE